MIRKLTEADREPLMALICKEPALNLFIIGDVENFGFEQDFMDLWGEFDTAERQIKAVLLRFYRSYLPYAEGPFDVEGFSEIMRKDKDISMISGRSDVVQAFTEVLQFREEKHMLFAEMKELKLEISEMEQEIRDTKQDIGDTLTLKMKSIEQNIDESLSAKMKGLEHNSSSYLVAPDIIKKATVDDVEAICALTDIIEEFQFSPEGSRTNLRKKLESGTGRTYFIEREGQVIATASTSAENSMSAMIIAVATHPSFRGHGLASRVVAKMCADLLNEGKSLCLFYDNPQAGIIYKRLGFYDIGSWSMAFV